MKSEKRAEKIVLGHFAKEIRGNYEKSWWLVGEKSLEQLCENSLERLVRNRVNDLREIASILRPGG